MQITPTIIEKQFDKAEGKIKLIKDEFRWIQLDVIDGIFSFGRTFELELLNRTTLNLDNNLWEVHLMVKEPIKWIEKCNFIGASRVVGQVEMMNNRYNFINEVKNIGMEAGLGFDIDTPLEEIPEETDMVILMARKAGFETYNFDKRVFEKINKLKKIRNEGELNFKIGIDGGVNESNILELKNAGVDIAYCGGAIFNGNVKDNLDKLYEKIS